MTPDEKHVYARSFPVHVGVDTAKLHVLVAQGPDGRRSKPCKVLVSRAGFQATHAHLQSLFPQLTSDQMLVGLEFAGHHGFLRPLPGRPGLPRGQCAPGPHQSVQGAGGQ